MYFFPVFIMHFVKVRSHTYMQLQVLTESSSKKWRHDGLYQADTCCLSNLFFNLLWLCVTAHCLFRQQQFYSEKLRTTRAERSRNHCCRGRKLSITYSECVCSLSYPASKEPAPYYIVTCGLSSSITFPHVISQTARFSGEKSY